MNIDNCQDSINAFEGYKLSLQDKDEGFIVIFLRSDQGRLTRYI